MPGPSEPPGRLIDRLPARAGPGRRHGGVDHRPRDRLQHRQGIRSTWRRPPRFGGRSSSPPPTRTGRSIARSCARLSTRARSSSPTTPGTTRTCGPSPPVMSPGSWTGARASSTPPSSHRETLLPPALRVPPAAADAAAADVGCSTMVLWLGRSRRLLPSHRRPAAGQRPTVAARQHIVIGHANLPTVTHLYGQIVDILRSRSLHTATLDDVFYATAAARQRTVG